MFFNLNITDYIIYHMKKEILGSVVFVGFVFSVNYILTNLLNEYSNNVGEKIQEDITTENVKCENSEECDLQMEKFNNLSEQQDTEKDTEQDTEQDETIKFLDSVKDVIETGINDDVLMVEKILERKRYLLNLNDRLSEIKDKLRELQSELSRS